MAADGRIEPGDMLLQVLHFLYIYLFILMFVILMSIYKVAFHLQVNDINFENMSNDDAVKVLRDIVHKPGCVLHFS